MTLTIFMVGWCVVSLWAASKIFATHRTPNLSKRDLWCLGWKPTHRHYKGSFYEEATRATSASDILEGEIVVVYVSQDGRTYVRVAEEFDQSPRFMELHEQ